MVIRREIRTAHNKGKPNKQESVVVGGTSYRSTWTAFTALGLGTEAQCERFRKHLKLTKNGSAIYAQPLTGEKFEFKLIPYNPRL